MIRLTIPVLSLGLYLSFAAFNSQYVDLGEIALWSLFALVVGIIAMLIAWRVSKNVVLQVMVGFLMLLGFYSYGYFFHQVIWEAPTQIQMLQVLYISLIPLIILAFRHIQPDKVWKPFLVTFAIISVIYPFTMVIIPPKIEANPIIDASEQKELDRSIYIIILDRYARADILEKYFNFDNSPFLGELKSRGFEVSETSRTNYNWTMNCMASMLNLEYLDTLLADSGVSEAEKSYVPLRELQRNSTLEQLAGDNWINLGSWAGGIPNDDVLLGEYPSKLISSTILHPALLLWNSFATKKWREDNTEKFPCKAILYTKEWALHLLHAQFNTLQKHAQSTSNDVMLVHIISPHPPYIADADGNPVDYSLPVTEQYIGQLQYTNKLILEWLDGVSPDDVVILMSDEGPIGHNSLMPDSAIVGDFASEQLIEIRQANLMATRGVPLYEGITTVNVMRILTNKYLGTDLELLEDKAYDMPDHMYPYKWEEVK